MRLKSTSHKSLDLFIVIFYLVYTAVAECFLIVLISIAIAYLVCMVLIALCLLTHGDDVYSPPVTFSLLSAWAGTSPRYL